VTGATNPTFRGLPSIAIAFIASIEEFPDVGLVVVVCETHIDVVVAVVIIVVVVSSSLCDSIFVRFVGFVVLVLK